MCKPNPCNNGATCLQLGSYGYACKCTPDCTGYNCSECVAQTTPHQLLNVSKIRPPSNKPHINKIEEPSQAPPPTQDLEWTTNILNTEKMNEKICKNLNKTFCKKFRILTLCRIEFIYLGVSLKSYCCDLCL